MLYAAIPARRTLQVTGDVLMLVWVLLWVWVGRLVHDITMLLAAPGRALESAGGGFADRMKDAARSVDNLPVLNDRVATPFDNVAGAGDSIAGAGADLVSAVGKLALVLGVVTASVPIVIVGAFWLWRRIRFVRRAEAAQRFIDADVDLDLFALRAMASQPMERIAAISPDPSGAWRRGDRDVIRRLAELELRDCGLRPPAAAASPG